MLSSLIHGDTVHQENLLCRQDSCSPEINQEKIKKLKEYLLSYNSKFGKEKSCCMSRKVTQTEFFRKNIPHDCVDFTDTFTNLDLDVIFTSDKIVTKVMGNYNCNHVFRQTKIIPDIVVCSNANHVVFQPIGEPGRDLGNHSSKGTHLMVVTHGENCPITMNEALPTTDAENDDLKERIKLLNHAYDLLKKNEPISQCGEMVIQRAQNMGIPTTMGVRDFMVKQISGFSPEFRAGRPGYKLLNQDNVDVSSDEKMITDCLSPLLSDKLKPVYLIQGPDNCSQLLSHVHGFLLQPGSIPKTLEESYINVNDILIAKGTM